MKISALQLLSYIKCNQNSIIYSIKGNSFTVHDLYIMHNYNQNLIIALFIALSLVEINFEDNSRHGSGII